MANPNEGQRQLRALAPLEQAPESSGSGSGDRIGSTSRPLQPKAGKVIHPCEPCRRRKVKCSGVQPSCNECRTRGIECTYADPDTTRALKKKLTETQERLKEYHELYGMLQTRPETEVGEIVRRIRQGHSASSVIRFIRDGDLLTQLSLAPESWFRHSLPLIKEMPSVLQQYTNLYLKSLLYQGVYNAPPTARIRGSEAPYFVPYNAAELVETRLDSTQVSNWTSVSDDDGLLRDLLKSYFLLQYPMFPFFHKEYFLNDLLAGRQGFCSSLLVNAILAAACQGYRKSSNRTEFWSPRTLQYQFASEARRLKEIGIQENSITNIQAGLVMSLTCNMNAEDKIGWYYLVQTVAMAESIRLFDPRPASAKPEMRIVWEFTAWAVFGWQSTFCFHFFKPPLIDVPRIPLPDPSKNPAWYPDCWLLYPSTNTPVRIHLGYHFQTVAELRVLQNKIASVAFATRGTKSRMTFNEAWSLYQDLLHWYNNLGDMLTARSAVLPYQLVMHMQYFNTIIYLLSPFVSAGCSPANTTILSEAPDSPEAIVISAKICFETIARLYYLRHGFSCYDPMTTQFHSFMGFMSLRTLSELVNIPPETLTAIHSTLALALQGLRDQADSSYLASTLYWLLWDALDEDSAAALGPLTRNWKGETGDEEKKLIPRHVQSVFPVGIESVSEDPEEKNVGNLVAAYKQLGLEGDEGSGESQSSSGAT